MSISRPPLSPAVLLHLPICPLLQLSTFCPRLQPSATPFRRSTLRHPVSSLYLCSSGVPPFQPLSPSAPGLQRSSIPPTLEAIPFFNALHAKHTKVEGAEFWKFSVETSIRLHIVSFLLL
ncbi:hypothetical protein RIF29_38146 [Crotalaria pallida]|uniref:Uncharacterized protein n=1 Tax=Crotalaria pallida TaxID=3830 RepID=A0AAN9E1P1_CROPI